MKHSKKLDTMVV